MQFLAKFLLVIFLSGSLYSQKPDSLEITGNLVFDKQEYSNIIEKVITASDSDTVSDSIVSSIATFLINYGYLSPEIVTNIFEYQSNGNDRKGLRILINAGEPSYYEFITFTGEPDSLIPQEIFDLAETLKGSIYNSIELSSIIKEILIYYEKSGFPFASIKLISLRETKAESGSKALNILLEIDKNVEAKIDRIEIEGNSSTRDFVILRETGIKVGDFYNENKIDLVPQKLNRLKFFEPVKLPVFYLTPEGKGVLRISVKEIQTNNFDGVIGYVPPQVNEETGYLTGVLNLNLRNLFGTGRGFLFKWQQYSRNSQELEIRYLEPYILDYPFNIDLSLFQRKQDTLYVNRKIGAVLEYMATSELTFGVQLASEEVIPTLFETPFFTVFNSSFFTSGITLKYDTRDDPFFPVKGLLFSSGFSISSKKINGPAEFLTQGMLLSYELKRFISSLNFYFSFFNRQVFAFSANVRELQGDLLENSDLYRLGGTSSLRGYREEQFTGNRIVWSNLEYRFLLAGRTYIFGFFDSGYYFRSADESQKIVENSGFKLGYGFGISLETGLGMLGVSFAIAGGEDFSRGKIHFGIINDF